MGSQKPVSRDTLTAPTFSELTNGASAVSGTGFSSASITPTADKMVIVAVANGSTAPTPEPTSVIGCGITFVKITSQTVILDGQRLTLWIGITDSPTNDTIDITYPSSVDYCLWSVIQCGNVYTPDSDLTRAVRQAVSNTNLSQTNTASVTALAAFEQSLNGTFVAVHNRKNQDIVPGTNLTQLSDVGLAAPARRLFTGYRAAPLRSPTVSWTSVDFYSMINWEIRIGKDA